MTEGVAIFLPIRLGSKRVKNKNTRPFANYGFGLLELKLGQLNKCCKVDQIVVSSNDEKALTFVEKFQKEDTRFQSIKRPESLCKDETNLADLIQYVPSVTDYKHILWTHVTSPFVDEKLYDEAIQVYFSELEKGYDSLMSVTPFQSFIWDKEKNDIINRKDQQRWPKTQDLKKYYEINSAIFIANRNIYQKEKDRVGKKPKLYEMDDIESLDVDWKEDFEIAEAIYERRYL